ncbi:DUF29 domain-containing protein [Pseudanabaena sp. ABRG5-3]|uniref:DUF29 domain-containing protein n=1 Tax=Pseudanabaena sp. ABRG5-3 TaxID=685565 RepID=UPI000DC70C88|nr:DUF29 domain-containing protein [Pseudanabaena sp. ABRG5-3]BBC24021.1 hypothetical protein ABRG53_1764 [Pseudanabaena sp. ABRG5-3]
MTQAIAPKTLLYERDLNLWIETAIAQLKAGNLQDLDIENLIEELEGLAGRDRRELRNRLATLLEHLLKRCYVRSEYDYAGWEITIERTRFEIIGILEQSPSLKSYINSAEVFDQAFAFALRIVRKNQGYKNINFPDTWQFSHNIDAILNVDFWIDIQE